MKNYIKKNLLHQIICPLKQLDFYLKYSTELLSIILEIRSLRSI